LPEHGVVAVPWARHGAGHTRLLDDQIAWLAVACSKSAVMGLMIAQCTVGAIVTRVAEDAMAGVNRFARRRRIGVDEISHKKRHRYLIVVVDHDSRRLIWAAPNPAAVGAGREPTPRPGHDRAWRLSLRPGPNRSRPTHRPRPLRPSSLRRAASASRTGGRYTVDPSADP
jgi:hypothetical protein